MTAPRCREFQNFGCWPSFKCTVPICTALQTIRDRFLMSCEAHQDLQLQSCLDPKSFRALTLVMLDPTRAWWFLSNLSRLMRCGHAHLMVSSVDEVAWRTKSYNRTFFRFSTKFLRNGNCHENDGKFIATDQVRFLALTM